MKFLQLLIATTAFISLSTFANTQQFHLTSPGKKLKQLEKTFDGKIGVYAIDTNSNRIIAYRANERFPMQSTFKVMGVSALLKLSTKNKNLLQEKIHYTKKDLIPWHPITGKNLTTGMTLERLAEAAVSYSDNPAINLIMKKLGGPKSITTFAHAIGNKTFNLKHYEGNLNSNPKNKDDTSTPKDMAISLKKLMLGKTLREAQRKQLIKWMRNNTTGNKKIRVGVPVGWVVADKTGSGNYGVSNDIAIIWSLSCKPIVLAIYTVQNKPKAKGRDDMVAKSTHIIFDAFSRSDYCFRKKAA